MTRFLNLNLLLVFVPISVVLELVHGPPLAIFVTACLAIIPLAGLMGTATDELAKHLGATIGVEPRFLPSSRLGRVGGVAVPPAGALGLE